MEKENVSIWTYNINGSVSGIEFLDDYNEGIGFFINGKEINIGTHHDQDCCEHVYGDFSNFKYHKEDIERMTIEKIEIKAIPDIGLLVCFLGEHDIGVKVLVPCYNEQNGYYSDDLELRLKVDGLSTTIDVSDYVKDNIC